MRRQDFTYQLPDELIARFPSKERSGSRLLYLPRDGALQDRQFPDLIALLQPGDLLVMNDSRVIPARLFARKQSGGKVEILLERLQPENKLLAKLRASKTPKTGTVLVLPDGSHATVTGRDEDLFCLQFENEAQGIFDQYGEVPLPPYLERTPEDSDVERYQTVYAANKGSVAAPTAGLHFDQTMLDDLKRAGIQTACVTLHVGSGTYQPVRADKLSDHKMHAEYVSFSEELADQIRKTKTQGGRVVAVGTTSLRTLEAAAANGELGAYEGDTRLFIYPGFKFNVVDVLLTNFHLSESSLLMLVSAFAGRRRIMATYQHAIAERYRFFSYGDAMLIEQHPDGILTD